MKNIIFIAPPAAGKGTISNMLKDTYNMTHISTGDLLRDETTSDSELGNYIKEKMQSGALVSDEIILDLLKQRISKDDCNDGYILDGFPRNVEQAKAYENILQELNKDLGYVFLLDVDKELAKKRIVGRISCPKCGAVYNEYIEDTQPKEKGICDNCHIALVKREDDNKETFEKRFSTYFSKTEPLINYYKEKGVLYNIPASCGKDTTFNAIKEVIFGDNK